MKRPEIIGGQLLRKVESAIFQLTRREVIRYEVLKPQFTTLQQSSSFPVVLGLVVLNTHSCWTAMQGHCRMLAVVVFASSNAPSLPIYLYWLGY